MTALHSRPAAPVCLVINLAPSILDANSLAWAGLRVSDLASAKHEAVSVKRANRRYAASRVNIHSRRA
jgi:hypothetical protein